MKKFTNLKNPGAKRTLAVNFRAYFLLNTLGTDYGGTNYLPVKFRSKSREFRFERVNEG